MKACHFWTFSSDRMKTRQILCDEGLNWVSGKCSAYLVRKVLKNIARSEQSSHTPAVAIRGCNTFRGNLFGEKEKRKKKGQIKGLISHMWLILLYTVQPVIPDVCTKFQNPRSSSS